MSNPLRHILGIPIGVIVTVATWLGLGWASTRLSATYAAYFGLKLTGAALGAVVVIIVLAVLLGLVTSARFMSPLAALIPGVVFLVLGFALLALPKLGDVLFRFAPEGTSTQTFGLSAQGIYPLLGLLLIVSAISPHRWRAKRGPVARQYADYRHDAPPRTHHLSGAPIEGPRPPAPPAPGREEQPPAPGYPADDRPVPPDQER